MGDKSPVNSEVYELSNSDVYQSNSFIHKYLVENSNSFFIYSSILKINFFFSSSYKKMSLAIY